MVAESGHNSSPKAALRTAQEKFRHFSVLLDRHNRVLRTTSDMEEKALGEYLFDLNYIRNALRQLEHNLTELVNAMIALGGERYEPLRDRLGDIVMRAEQAVPGRRGIPLDDYVLRISELGSERARSVGSKMAQLGEMKTRLRLPVPDGFAISAWAYKHFIDFNDLQSRINRFIESLNFSHYKDLVAVSRRIRRMIMTAEVPREVAEAIWGEYNAFLSRRPNRRLAVRSSALGEDTLYSFAGQYASFLNVRGEELIDRYREVLISAFTPQAIYYFLSHAFTASDLAMSAGCVEMVDAVSAGVIYTRSPVPTPTECMLISSVFGLGRLLVEGRITPDSFCLCRATGDVLNRNIARKQRRLVLELAGGTREEAVPEAEQMQPSVSDDQLRQLAEFAQKIEQHYGAPQDIEFAIDQRGRIFFLQTRPLRVSSTTLPEPTVDTSDYPRLFENGVTVSPGVGGGPVYHAGSMEDLADLPDGAVLVTPNSFPGIITVMERVSAIITGIGGLANHMATIAREYEVPTLGGLVEAGRLETGRMVTVDAGQGVVYDGLQSELIQTASARPDLLDDMAIFTILRAVLDYVSPLNLLHPDVADFSIENCRTVHDLARFVHQKAMEEMFSGAMSVHGSDTATVRLKTDMPMEVRLVYLDREPPQTDRHGCIAQEALESVPMEAFWRGVKEEGWPRAQVPKNFKKLTGATVGKKGTNGELAYSSDSYVILSHEYMVFNVHMGYHLASVEAMASEEPSKNYIRMQYKDGGAPLDRRIRRIKLIAGILKKLGFENRSSQDYLNALLAYQTREEIGRKLVLLGRLTMMTKQLDMALSSDNVAEWYQEDFLRKLGVTPPARRTT